MCVIITIIMLINVDFMHCPQWLETEFLAYLDEWERSVNGHPGFDDADKKRMLLSQETLLGLRITG